MVKSLNFYEKYITMQEDDRKCYGFKYSMEINLIFTHKISKQKPCSQCTPIPCYQCTPILCSQCTPVPCSWGRHVWSPSLRRIRDEKHQWTHSHPRSLAVACSGRSQRPLPRGQTVAPLHRPKLSEKTSNLSISLFHKCLLILCSKICVILKYTLMFKIG